jgi:outer membrane biogenesis lipoprotein LolB
VNHRKLAAVTLIAAMLATTPCFASRSHGTRGASHATYSSHRKKSQHVSSYTTKSGKHVNSYNRRPPR